MPRLASLYLPFLATDRIRRADGRPDRVSAAFPAASQGTPRPRAPGFRPGARWAWDEAVQSAETLSGGSALVTAGRAGSRICLCALSSEAESLGLVPGMALTQARMLVPDLDVRDSDPEGDQAFLLRLARAAARRWTPRAALSGPDGLWLDLTGTAHLFGGEEEMCRRIIAACSRFGLAARIAVAGTSGAAFALARFGGETIRILDEGEESEALNAFPIAALRLDPSILAGLRRLGIDTIGKLASMPRAPLQRRFGPDLLLRLDQARGLAAEPLDPVFPAQPVSVRLRFVEPIATPEAIGQALEEGLGRLVRRLAGAWLGVRRLEISCVRVDGETQCIEIGTARATRDGPHLVRLALPRVEEIEPGFGLERIILVARRTERLEPETISKDWTGDGKESSEDLALLVDRLSGRLGRERIYRPASVESDVPERSVRRISPLEPAPSWPRWPRPVRLLHPPEPVGDVMALLPDQPPRRFTWRGSAYRVRQADGPERIHGEWWRNASEALAVRDYFQVEDEEGRRFWLFRRGDGEDPRTGDLGWYMHGVFA